MFSYCGRFEIRAEALHQALYAHTQHALRRHTHFSNAPPLHVCCALFDSLLFLPFRLTRPIHHAPCNHFSKEHAASPSKSQQRENSEFEDLTDERSLTTANVYGRMRWGAKRDKRQVHAEEEGRRRREGLREDKTKKKNQHFGPFLGGCSCLLSVVVVCLF